MNKTETNIQVQQKLASAQDVADCLGIHPDTVYRLTREHLIPCRRVGPRLVRYVLADVVAALSQQPPDQQRGA